MSTDNDTSGRMRPPRALTGALSRKRATIACSAASQARPTLT
jgi:hypothetical protein